MPVSLPNGLRTMACTIARQRRHFSFGEHLGHLPPASVKKFLSDVATLRKPPDVSPQTRFRFVRSARFLKDGRTS
jgi:hypothetical protein